MLAALLGLTACGTTQDHRARQYSEAAAQLPDGVRAQVLAGRVAVGMSPEAVYIALGAPLENGRAMYMPEVPEQGNHRWYYRGNSEALGRDDTGISIRFLSQFESVIPNTGDLQYLVVDFEDRKVAKIWLMDGQSKVLEMWE